MTILEGQPKLQENIVGSKKPFLEPCHTEYAMPFWPCHVFLGGPACWSKFFKLVWIIAYSIQKDLWKNNQPFSCNNILTKYGRGSATPL